MNQTDTYEDWYAPLETGGINIIAYNDALQRWGASFIVNRKVEQFKNYEKKRQNIDNTFLSERHISYDKQTLTRCIQYWVQKEERGGLSYGNKSGCKNRFEDRRQCSAG